MGPTLLLEPELDVFVLDAEGGTAGCEDDDAAVELDSDEVEVPDADDEDVNVTLVDDELDEVVELAVTDVKVGSANNNSVPEFGAQSMYE
jgi:hypothetical protein